MAFGVLECWSTVKRPYIFKIEHSITPHSPDAYSPGLSEQRADLPGLPGFGLR